MLASAEEGRQSFHIHLTALSSRQESIDELLNSQNCNSLVGQRDRSVAYDNMAGKTEQKRKPQHAYHHFGF